MHVFLHSASRPLIPMLVGLAALIAAGRGVAGAQQPRGNLESIIGPLSSTVPVQVRVAYLPGPIPDPARAKVATLPVPLPDPVSSQLARLYTYVVHDRLGERAKLSLSERILDVQLVSRREPTGDPRALLRANMLSALNRAADAKEARGQEVLANWYVGWARWFSELGVDTVRGEQRTNTLAWARAQPPAVLRRELTGRMTRLIDLVALTPIQLP